MAVGSLSERVLVWSPGLHAAEGVRYSRRDIAGAAVRAAPLALLLTFVAVVHAINMFRAPFYFDDEGIYMSQAWSVLTSGKLAPYTFFYDHPPLGWFTIAFAAKLFGGFGAFGASVNGGRVLMLIAHVVSALLVYRITRRLGGTGFAGVVAVLIFGLSPFQILFGRQVLLDNLATVWMLLSLYFATSKRLSITGAILSGAAMGLALLNKEIVAPMIPGLLAVLWVRLNPQIRLIGIAGWLFAALGLASFYPLYAFLKGELFPYGSILDFSSEPHVSLIGGLLFHQGRGGDFGFFEPGSMFWRAAAVWWRMDPALVVGLICAIPASVLLARRHSGLLGLGLMLLGLLAFLGQGRVVFDFWLLAGVPLVAIVIALAIDYGKVHLPSLLWPCLRTERLLVAAPIGAIMVLAATAGTGYEVYAHSYGRAFTGDETHPQTQAIDWLKENVDKDAFLVIDTYAYIDLRQFTDAHSFWKVDRDPDVSEKLLAGDWRNIDYVVLTPVMSAAARDGLVPLVGEAIEHSEPVVVFEGDRTWVEIRQVAPDPSRPGVADESLGENCSTYTGPDGVCVVELGDVWFCDESYQGGLCPTTVLAGDIVRWEYPAGRIAHTTTDCGTDCDAPTDAPLWDSGVMEPGDSFEFTFDTPGEYAYYCLFHLVSQRGVTRVLEPAAAPTPTATPSGVSSPAAAPTEPPILVPAATPTSTAAASSAAR